MKSLIGSLSVAALAGLSVSAARLTAPNPHPAAETFAVDNVHSAVTFHAKHLGISEAYGRFDQIADKSRLVLDADSAKSSILLVVLAESVNTNSGDRDKHLRSGDFFAAKEFPEIVFQSKQIKASSKDWEVTGELTFHGVTKTVTARARQVGKGDSPFGDHRVGFAAEFSIDMRDYGIEFLKQNPTAVGPEVHLSVSIEGIRQP